MPRHRGTPPFDVPAQEIPAATTAAAGSAGHYGMTAAHGGGRPLTYLLLHECYFE